MRLREEAALIRTSRLLADENKRLREALEEVAYSGHRYVQTMAVDSPEHDDPCPGCIADAALKGQESNG